MNEALTLITSLGKDGKSPLEIALELLARGIKGRGGRVFSLADVEGFLRFIGATGIEFRETKISQATWGSRSGPSELDFTNLPIQEMKRKNRTAIGSRFTDAQKEEIKRLYLTEHMKGGEIAKLLGVRSISLNPYLSHLAGYSVPPGEIVEVIDDQGRRILKCPPGYARGAAPQRNVRPTQGGW